MDLTLLTAGRSRCVPEQFRHTKIPRTYEAQSGSVRSNHFHISLVRMDSRHQWTGHYTVHFGCISSNYNMQVPISKYSLYGNSFVYVFFFLGICRQPCIVFELVTVACTNGQEEHTKKVSSIFTSPCGLLLQNVKT